MVKINEIHPYILLDKEQGPHSVNVCSAYNHIMHTNEENNTRIGMSATLDKIFGL